MARALTRPGPDRSLGRRRYGWQDGRSGHAPFGPFGNKDNSVVTGPTPGNASSCSAVAVFWSTGAIGDGGPEGAVAATPDPAVRLGTSTCWPSARGAARLTSVESAFAVVPPARPTASAMGREGFEPSTLGLRVAVRLLWELAAAAQLV